MKATNRIQKKHQTLTRLYRKQLLSQHEQSNYYENMSVKNINLFSSSLTLH